MKPTVAGQDYVFGPFQLSLPDGWTGEMIDQIHQLQPPSEDFAIHMSGYTRDAPVAIDDLHGFPKQLFNTEGTPFELASGLDGVTFDTETEEGPMRYWLLYWDNAMIVITLTSEAPDLASAAIPAQMIISSIRPTGD